MADEDRDAGRGFFHRVVRALRLDAAVFDEIEADTAAISQAFTVVVLAGLARGILCLGTSGPGIAANIALAIVLWVVASALLSLVGVRWVQGTTDFREMLRTLGFAAAPLWFGAPAYFLPAPVQATFTVGLHVWAIWAAVVAIRQALDVDTPRALLACGLALGLTVGLLLLLSAWG